MKATATNSLQSAFRVILADLQALPEDAYDKSFGPKARTVADIIYEVNLVNDHIGLNIRGEDMFDWPDDGWIKAPEDFRTKDAVIAGFQSSRDRMLKTLDGLSEKDVEGTVQTEDGETTRFERCQFMALHMWYHSGQLNFIQTLIGDDGWHW